MKISTLVKMLLSFSFFIFSASVFAGNVDKYESIIVDNDYSLEVSKYSDYHKEINVSHDALNGIIYKSHQSVNSIFDDIRSMNNDLIPTLKVQDSIIDPPASILPELHK